jgi:hypothetical protein
MSLAVLHLLQNHCSDLQRLDDNLVLLDRQTWIPFRVQWSVLLFTISPLALTFPRAVLGPRTTQVQS